MKLILKVLTFIFLTVLFSCEKDESGIVEEKDIDEDIVIEEVTATIAISGFEEFLDSIEIIEGDEVSFESKDNENVISWKWYFEGATPDNSTKQNQIVKYNTPGTFDLSLIVSSKNSSDTLSFVDYVKVNELKTVEASIGVGDFDSLFLSGEKYFYSVLNENVISWEWNFEGGVPDSYIGQTPPPIYYDSPGEYNVSLTVKSENDESTTVESSIVKVGQDPNLDAVFNTGDPDQVAIGDIFIENDVLHYARYSESEFGLASLNLVDQPRPLPSVANNNYENCDRVVVGDNISYFLCGNQILFNQNGVERSISGFKTPHDLAYKDGYIYVVEYGENRISKVNVMDVDPVITEVVSIDYAVYLAFHGNELYISQTLGGKVSKINVLSQNPTIQTVTTEVYRPGPIVIGNDNLYVSNFYDQSITKINLTGSPRTAIDVVQGIGIGVIFNSFGFHEDDLYATANNGILYKIPNISEINP